MERKAGELMDRMAAIPDWNRLPRKEISWDQAMACMMEGNLDLKRSEQSLRTTERAVVNVFTQIIPGVNLDWMLTKELSELSRVTAQDVEYNTNILFNMPSLTQIPFDYYSAKSAVYTAQKTLEMKKRELVSRLYRQVLSYQNARISYRNRLNSLPYNDDGIQKKIAEQELEKSLDDISEGFATLMGNMEARWLVRPETMPRLDWGKYKSAARHLDLLVVTMVAMELEASRLQVLNAKMKFFPSVDINFYSPTLFSSTGGTYQGFFAGGGDMQVNMSLREELDTRLISWFQYKTAKENHDLMQKKVLMDLQQRRIKVAALMESRRRFEIWKQVILKEIEFKKSRMAFSGKEYLEQRKDIKTMYENLDSETAKNAEVEAALIMEYGWLK
ncbi:hypothetical protein [Akkermansia sp.]|jgi:hypothetical protein